MFCGQIHSVALTTRYISEKKNILADHQVLPTEGSLLPWAYNTVCKVFGHPLIELFSARANTKLLSYVPLVLDPTVWKQEAFQHPWDDLSAYTFSSSSLIRQVLFKVQLSTRLSFVLIALL